MTYILGVDPGPTPGLVGFDTTWRNHGTLSVQVVQCSANVFPDVLMAVAVGQGGVILAVERFVVAPITAKSNSPGAGRVTLAVIEECRRFAHVHGHQCVLRSASEVKPWATDVRLHAAGLWPLTVGMTHARDAARHALFAAVHDGGLLDPLSRSTSPA